MSSSGSTVTKSDEMNALPDSSSSTSGGIKFPAIVTAPQPSSESTTASTDTPTTSTLTDDDLAIPDMNFDQTTTDTNTNISTQSQPTAITAATTAADSTTDRTATDHTTTDAAAAPPTDTVNEVNYNYVFHTLRTKIAKQDEQLSEKDAQINELQYELSQMKEQLADSQKRVQELELAQATHSSSLQSLDDRAKELDSDLFATRFDLAKKTTLIETLEAEKKTFWESITETMTTLHERLKEHTYGAEMLLEEAGGLPSNTSGGIMAANSSSTSASTTKLDGKSDKGKTSSKFVSTFPTNIQSYSVSDASPKKLLTRATSHSSKYSSKSAMDKNTANVNPAQLLAEDLSNCASQYELMLHRLKEKISDQERQLIGLYKWKSRAQEFANTWDQERIRLKDRIKSGLLESEQLKTQKDSYKILLKVVTVKLFMQHSHLRKQVRELYRKLVELTTDMLIEQKFSGGLTKESINNPGGSSLLTSTGHNESVQTENAEELLVRIQQKMNEKPWSLMVTNHPHHHHHGALGSPTSSSNSTALTTTNNQYPRPNQGVGHRPPAMKLLLDSFDSELIRLISASSDILAAKKQWQETAEAFFQRNIELTQSVSGHDLDLTSVKTRSRDLEHRCEELERQVQQLQAASQTMEATYKAKIHELHATRTSNAGEIRAKKTEVQQLFEKNVDLQRRIRESELSLLELEKKEQKLNDKNNALLAEQKKLLQAITQAKAVEASILKGNSQQFQLLIQAQTSAALHAQSRKSLASSPSSLGPLIGSPSSSRMHPVPPPAPQFNNFTRGGSNSQLSSTASLSYPQHQGFQQTMPLPSHHTSGLQYNYSQASFGQQSQASLAPPSQQTGQLSQSPSATQPLTGGGPVLATIRARPQMPASNPGMSAQQWAALATLPPHLLPLSSRSPPTIQPSASSRSTKKGSRTSRTDKQANAEQRQLAHAAKLALNSAIQRETLDRALFRAAKSGLGRGLGSGNAKKLKSKSQPVLIAPLENHTVQPSDANAVTNTLNMDQSESKENTHQPSPPPPALPPSTSLKDMMMK